MHDSGIEPKTSQFMNKNKNRLANFTYGTLQQNIISVGLMGTLNLFAINYK